MKYDAAGTEAWVDGASGSVAEGRAVTALSDGSRVVAGTYSRSVVVGRDDPSPTTLPDLRDEMFLARFGPDGVHAWALAEGGQWYEYPGGQTTLSDDSVVLVGSFLYAVRLGTGRPGDAVVVGGAVLGGAAFGLGEPCETTVTSEGGWDAFHARYGPDGSL